MCRGVRGATVAAANTRAAILEATRELLAEIIAANDIAIDEVASIFFTMTPDLTQAYPATAAREMGWSDLALLCAQEIDCPVGLPRMIRVLFHWNTKRSPQEITHIYINGAEALRPDRTYQK
ncbi:MAG: chorismate mutase [Chloroflexi bacterium]|nr:chorismate mutase [Chloroflexota bacterium]